MFTSLTTILLPCVPFLAKNAGAAAIKLVVAKIGESAWEKAQVIWTKLLPKINQDTEAKLATDELANNPEDEDWQMMFVKKLQTILENDAELRQEIAAILQDVEEESLGTQTKIQLNVESNQGQVIGQTSNSEAKNIGTVDNIQGDINF